MPKILAVLLFFSVLLNPSVVGFSSTRQQSPQRGWHFRDWKRGRPCVRLDAVHRSGAMSRKKSFGGGSDKTNNNDDNNDNSNNVGVVGEKGIYSMPALYDLAFGYRDYEEEVAFLVERHKKHAGKEPNRILELAAGPSRHSLAALSNPDWTTVIHHATALDLSTEMMEYSNDLANEMLDTSSRRACFDYVIEDMRRFSVSNGDGDDKKMLFDTAWMLLGSMQHLNTNEDVVDCFRSVYETLQPGGTLVLELPHPRETFSMVECTRNDWKVPLDDSDGTEFGELRIVWGDDDDPFDPITQVRNFTVSFDVDTKEKDKEGELQSVRQVVPLRLFTTQEIKLFARCCGFSVVEMFGALSDEVSINDGEAAYRLVCVLQKDHNDGDDANNNKQ